MTRWAKSRRRYEKHPLNGPNSELSSEHSKDAETRSSSLFEKERGGPASFAEKGLQVEAGDHPKAGPFVSTVVFGCLSRKTHRAAFFSLLKLSCRAETLARSIRLIQFARRLFFFCLECVCVASSDLGRAWGISAEVCGNLHLFSVSCGSRSSFDSSLRNGACKIAKVHVLRTCKARLVNLVPELETTP